jgi:hypothetical protein
VTVRTEKKHKQEKEIFSDLKKKMKKRKCVVSIGLKAGIIQEISVRIVFHRESTIEYPAIRPRICDYIRYW